VAYAINPHMLDNTGNLNQVDEKLAFKQWDTLKSKFEMLGLTTHIIEGDPAFPDMVFCANQTFEFIDKNNKKSLILSRMHSDFRKGEVKYFRDWALTNKYTLYEITDYDFEGCGDLIWNYDSQELYGGYGFRTQKSVYDQIEKITSKKIHLLELISEDFYHLDTCFVVLNKNTAGIVEEAFSPESVTLIRSQFSNVIIINKKEAMENFAGNALCVNGKDVVLHKGAKQFCYDLKALGFQTHEVDVSEFLKSGGAVFCMKQMLM
jgi:N-dimethylarginine dimethylaminohydrolase